LIPEELLGQIVVLDTDAPHLVIGTLEKVQEGSLVMVDVDLYDKRESNTTADLYLSNIQEHGVQVNRKRVFILLERVLGVSRLSDIQKF